jgi:hypothetical protein
MTGGLVAAFLVLVFTAVTWLVLAAQTPTSSEVQVSSIGVVLAVLATAGAALGFGLRVSALAWVSLILTVVVALFLALAWMPA